MRTLGLRGRLLLTFNLAALGLMAVMAGLEAWSQARIAQGVVGELGLAVGEARQQHQDETRSLRGEIEQAGAKALTVKIEALAQILADLAPTPLMTGDAEGIDALCAEIDRDSDVVWSAVLGKDGALASSYVGPDIAKRMRLEKPPKAAAVLAALPDIAGLQVVRRPVVQGGKQLGTVVVAADLSLLERQRQEVGARFSAMADRDQVRFATLEGRIAERIDASQRQALWWFVGAAVVGNAVVFALSLLMARALLRQIAQVGTALDGLAAGDLTRQAVALRHDEVGAMAATYNAAALTLGRSLREVAEGMQALTVSSQRLSGVSERMGLDATTTADQAARATATAQEVSAHAADIATGIAQLGASVSEIAGNAQEAARTASEAVVIAGETQTVVARLDEAGQQIGAIVKLVAGIAEQTNLLALNATIEAARAGEAGRGFAVVASEVKELARQTSAATQDIGAKTRLVREGGLQARQAIERIAAIIKRIDELQQSIAGAVEEQAATTREVGANVTAVATGAGDIARSIAAVAGVAGTTRNAAQETRQAAQELAQLAVELKATAARFRF